jgi:hypothetical protein
MADPFVAVVDELTGSVIVDVGLREDSLDRRDGPVH